MANIVSAPESNTEVAETASSYIHNRLCQLAEKSLHVREKLDKKTDCMRLAYPETSGSVGANRRPLPRYFEELSDIIETVHQTLDRIEEITNEMDI